LSIAVKKIKSVDFALMVNVTVQTSFIKMILKIKERRLKNE
jgi:hypothetical protein